MELEVVAVPDPEIEVNEKDKHEMSPRSIDKPLPLPESKNLKP